MGVKIVCVSPVYGAFSETLAGVTTIRAFRAAAPATAREARLVDASSRTIWPLRVLDRWLSVRLELLANGVVGGTALAYAIAPPTSAGVAGLALTSALQLTGPPQLGGAKNHRAGGQHECRGAGDRLRCRAAGSAGRHP